MQQRQDAATVLVGLGQHGLGGLGQDVIFRELCHFFCHICIPDGGFGRLGIFTGNDQIILGGFQAGDIGSNGGGFVQGVVDSLVDGTYAGWIALVVTEGPLGSFAGHYLGARKANGIGVHVIDVAVEGLIGFWAVVDNERVPLHPPVVCV